MWIVLVCSFFFFRRVCDGCDKELFGLNTKQMHKQIIYSICGSHLNGSINVQSTHSITHP